MLKKKPILPELPCENCGEPCFVMFKVIAQRESMSSPGTAIFVKEWWCRDCVDSDPIR